VPKGNPVQINCFVDADHARNRVTHWSQTGILIFLNCSPIIWYSKAQNTMETSTFGSEFTAMRITVELLESLHYKLRMFGIPLDGPLTTLSVTTLQLLLTLYIQPLQSRRSIMPWPTIKLERQ